MVKLATVAMEAKANVKYLNFNHLDLFSPNSITFTEKPLYAKQVFQIKRQKKEMGIKMLSLQIFTILKFLFYQTMKRHKR